VRVAKPPRLIQEPSVVRDKDGLGFVEIISLPRIGFLRGVFLANHLASTDNLTGTTKRQNIIQTKTNVTQKVALKTAQKNTLKKPMLRQRTDRFCLSSLLA